MAKQKLSAKEKAMFDRLDKKADDLLKETKRLSLEIERKRIRAASIELSALIRLLKKQLKH